MALERRCWFAEPPSKRNCPAKSIASSDEYATTILTLNDDCFQEIFQYLDLMDLCAVADACRRFRQNAEACFAYSKKKNLDLRNDVLREGDTYNEVVWKTSKVLRHFSKFIVALDEGRLIVQFKAAPLLERRTYYRKIIEVITQNSNLTLTELKLSDFRLCDDFTHLMGPLVERLQKLTLIGVLIEGWFLSMWPIWSAELRELRFKWVRTSWEQFDCLHQPFPKLVKIVLENVRHLQSGDIVEMLSHNSQLKEIVISNHWSLIPLDIILPAIVTYVPGVESLSLRLGEENVPLSDLVLHFAELRQLTKLILQIGLDSSPFIAGAIAQISHAKIPLKYLHLCRLKSYLMLYDFIGNMFRGLKQIETLKLSRVSGIESPHIRQICEYCSELSTLHLYGKISPSKEEIKEITRTLKKLRSLALRPEGTTWAWSLPSVSINIDIDDFKELLRIVESRLEQTHLTIELGKKLYTISVPDGLAKKHRRSLSIVYDERDHCFDREKPFDIFS